MRGHVQKVVLLLLAASFMCQAGCRALPPRAIVADQYNVSRELQNIDSKIVEVGAPNRIVDGIGWVVGIPGKVLLWDRRVSNHQIGEQTLETTTDYIAEHGLSHLKVRVNQYAPLSDWKRLQANTTVAWPYRYTVGSASVLAEAIFPNRILGGDHFNPWTQTIHLTSDIPAIALHELGHAKDFSRRKYPGTYGIVYGVWPIQHEAIASMEAMHHVYESGDANRIAEAQRILYPAFGTYLGGTAGQFAPQYASPLYVTAVIAGHLNAGWLNRQIDADLRRHRVLLSGRSKTRPADSKDGDADALTDPITSVALATP